MITSMRRLLRRLEPKGSSAAPIGAANPARSSSQPNGYLVTESETHCREYSNTATLQDIFYCFRLLLGRNPNPEEWPGHSARAGEDLASVVSSYVTSREFAQRGLTSKTYQDRVELVRLPRFSIFASAEDLAVGRCIVADHVYEPGISALLERYVQPGMAVVDIGANVGYLTMLLASLVGETGQVIAVEPNPENVRLLEASRRVNGFEHVRVLPVAAGRDTGLLVLNTSHSNGIAGDLPVDLDAILGSRLVPCFPLDAILPTDRRIGLIKLDVEGGEYNALIGLSGTIARDLPVIVSEFSPGALPGISHCTGPEYLSFLLAKGYRIAVIQPDGSEHWFGNDIDGVMDAYWRSGVDHIDIVARSISVVP